MIPTWQNEHHEEGQNRNDHQDFKERETHKSAGGQAGVTR